MNESKNARRERIAEAVYVMLMAKPNEWYSSYEDGARHAILAADAFIKALDEVYPQPKPGAIQQTLLGEVVEAAKELAEICNDVRLAPTGFTAALNRLMIAIGREEAARG